MNESFDVVVLGGGPCGLAAAAALARRHRRVGLFERNAFESPRVGETFGPEIASSLREIGAWDDFLALENIPFRGVRSAWGAESLVDRPSIFHPLGDGFHVDRARFDALLQRHARNEGAHLHEHVGIASIESFEKHWRLTWPNGTSVETRFLLDASGRGAPAGARWFSERRWIACDRAIGVVTRLDLPKNREFEPELLIETAEIGWWYVALQPGPSLLCVLMTDIDLIGANHRSELLGRWRAAFDASHHVRELCADSTVLDGPRIVRADTGFSFPHRGFGWRCIGDAAFASDPLSGDGIARGLSDAIAAVKEIDSFLEGNAPRSPNSDIDVDKRIPKYLDTRARYYRMEKRWSDSLFWKRRQGIDWQSADIALDPRTVLRVSDLEIDSQTIASVEALIPPRVIRMTLEQCKKPRAAHELLAFVRAAFPMENRRLLIALQELVATGILVEQS